MSRAKIFDEAFTWPDGFFAPREQSGQDWRHHSGGVIIITETNRRDYENLNDVEKCNHKLRNYEGPFLCYGFSDGPGVYDGAAVAWPGTWFIPTADPPQYYYSAQAEFFADSFYCFNYSSWHFGSYASKNVVRWDKTNTIREGSRPRDWTAGGGLTMLQNSNQSGGMKAWQEGRFIENSSDCFWTTYVYAVGGEIYQYPDSQNQRGEVKTTFNHTWTNRNWSWSYGCCPPGFSATPGSDSESEERRGTGVEFTY